MSFLRTGSRRSRVAVSLLATAAVGVGSVAIATTTGAAPTNLVKNPGLETDANRDGVPDGWSAKGYGVNTATFTPATAVHTGKGANKVTITSYTSGDRKLLNAYDTGGVPVTAGSRYDLSGWYRTNGDAFPVVFRRDAAGAWTYWTGAGALAKTSAYAPWSFTTPAVPQGTVAISFGLALKSVGWVTTDDYAMTLRAGTTTTTNAPAATTTTTKAPAASTTTTTVATPPPTTPPTTTPPTPSGNVLVEDAFNRPNGIITNEYAFWSSGAADARRDSIWQLNSGSLFAKDGAGFTGKPDNVAPNATSSNGNNSAVLRLLTQRTDLTNFEVDFKLRHEGFFTTSTTPAVDWDGVHVFLRYANEENLYYASIDRRDGTTQIKKKVSGGPSNGGTYYTLAGGRNPVPAGAWQNVRAVIVDQADGSVLINLYADGKIVASAVDRGTGGPVIRSGASGLRGDNSQFSFDDFVVRSR